MYKQTGKRWKQLFGGHNSNTIVIVNYRWNNVLTEY